MEKRRFPLLAWYLLTSVLAFIILGIGIYLAAIPPHSNWNMLAAGAVSLVVLGATWPIAQTLWRSPLLDTTGDQLLQTLIDRIDQISILLNLMSEQQLLSDRTKSIAFREKDRDAVRRAIQEEVSKPDWEAAFALVDEVERNFGLRSEAEALRTDIRNKRQEGVRKQINEVVAVIDRHTRSEQWNGALREAERLMGMFPDNEQVKNLPHEIDARRQAHKKQLLQSWQEAVARHDVDGSIEILKQLDPYLTPVEAEAMQETARGVFKEKLNNLGALFAGSIRDHKWTEAMSVGEQIMREFPNARIAQEVKEKMDLLRQRAIGTAVPTPGVPVTSPA